MIRGLAILNLTFLLSILGAEASQAGCNEDLAPVIEPTVTTDTSAWGDHKTELKYLIPDLGQIPKTILSALEKGENHPEILRRGFVIQQYLPVTSKNIAKVFTVLHQAGIPFGSAALLEEFLFPGHAREIRLMRKSIREQGQLRQIYQIAILGSGTLSVNFVTTPENLDDIQTQKIRAVFDAFQPEVYSIVRKAHFEILGTFAEHASQTQAQKISPSIKIDVFLSNVDASVSPALITGEVQFHEPDRSAAIDHAAVFRASADLRPHFLGADITDQLRFKARNVALMGAPALAQVALQDAKVSNHFHLRKILREFTNWVRSEVASLALQPPQKQLGVRISKKILLNAEPFGFGPSAAIAEIFPYLRERTETLAYIGVGHTLDLQGRLPYDDVFDYGDADPKRREQNFKVAAQDYDIFITASDFEAANWAKTLGLKVIIYDPLTWYWPEIPATLKNADFYVAQNFFGVTGRLQTEAGKFPENVVVPAIVSGLDDLDMGVSQKNLLVNMGGLSNPFLGNEDLTAFARIVFSSAQETLVPAFQNTFFATSRAIAQNLAQEFPVKTYQPQQIQKILAESKLAIMTSGLGNIYEASAMAKKVIWLPPANDSQGQQVKLLEQNGMMDWAIDWHQFLDGEAPINYFAPQPEVLKRIAHCMRRFGSELAAQEKFREILRGILSQARARERDPSRLAGLVQRFEAGGARLAAENIIQWMSQLGERRAGTR